MFKYYEWRNCALKIVKILSMLVLVAVLVSAFCSCSPLSSTKEEKEIVMTVGDYRVPYEIYYYISENLKADMPDADAETIESEVFETVKTLYAVFALGEDFGIEWDDEYINSVADDKAKLAIEECGGKDEYKKALAESNMNDSVYRFLERHSKTADEILSAIIDSEEYHLNDESAKSLVMSDVFACVKQILVVSENSVTTDEELSFSAPEKHTDEEALAIAEKAHSEAVAGADFDSLVNEYGEALYMFNNTDGYYLCRGMWDSVNEDAVFALGVGEISEVIESEKGYSVFLRCEKDEKYVENNIDTLANNYYRGVYNILLQEKIDSLTVVTNDVYDGYVNGEITEK